MLGGGIAIARAQVRGGARAQLAFFVLQLAHLSDQALGQAGVGRQALVVAADLLAQVFLFQFQQGFRIALFHPLDELRKETTEHVH